MADFKFYMPQEIMRQVAYASVESYLPTSPNLERVRYEAGGRNLVGEYPERVEYPDPFRGHITQTKEQRQAKQTADALAGDRTVFYLFDDVLDGTDYGVDLEQNDLIRVTATGELYEVVEVHEAQTSSGRAFGRAVIRGPKA